MCRRTEALRKVALAALGAALALAVGAQAASAAPATDAAVARGAADIGRAPTAAELRAWDIDVRADFKGLPPGHGSVDEGARIWEARCASCHGDFGESNAVFTPIVGGTTKKDIETGRTAALATAGGYPHRTTLMKLSKLSSAWDYIHRAMPWNAPKSLSDDDVYAVLAYILNLGDIVPADFTLSERNIAEVQARLPNRNGHVFYEPMWSVRGKGDTSNTLCMRDCPTGGAIESALPVAARNSNGNIAEQVRPFGPARGTDTALPPATTMASARQEATMPPVKATAAPMAASAAAPSASVTRPTSAAVCSACHGLDNKIVGPSFKDVAARYAGRADAADYLSGKILRGGSGVWGPIPMPPQAQLDDAEAHAIARWLAAGAK